MTDCLNRPCFSFLLNGIDVNCLNNVFSQDDRYEARYLKLHPCAIKKLQKRELTTHVIVVAS